MTADGKTKVYGNPDPELTAKLSGVLDGEDEEDVREALGLSLSRAEGSDVGTYAITVTGEQALEHYAVAYNGSLLEITKRPVTLTSTDDS